MRCILKVARIMMAVVLTYVFIVNFPFIMASFDEDRYVDGEVFRPVNDSFDFRKFKMTDKNAESYWALIQKSGYTQLIDKSENVTVNVFEWNKMTFTQKDRIYSSFMLELDRPYHIADGFRVIEMDFFSKRFYGAYTTNDNNSTLVYIITPCENYTLELIKTVDFKDR